MLIVGLSRICVASLVVFVLALTFVGRISVGDSNPFDYFGYFTNQTSLLTSIVLIATGALMAAGRSVPTWLMSARGVAAACLVIVAVIYNALVPGTGTAPAWVSAVLHVGFPLFVLGRVAKWPSGMVFVCGSPACASADQRCTSRWTSRLRNRSAGG